MHELIFDYSGMKKIRFPFNKKKQKDKDAKK